LNTSGVVDEPHLFVMKTLVLLVPPIGKRLRIFARFGLGDNIFIHSLANVEMTNVHTMKNFT
jgi:hypothetical protein